VEFLRLLLLVKTGSSESLEITAEDIKELKELANKASLPQILKAVKRFGQLELNLDNYSTLPLELAIVDATLPDMEVKAEPARRAEPEPLPRKVVPPKASAPPPEQKLVKSEGKKTPNPETPATVKPAAIEKPIIQKPESKEINPLASGSPIEQLQQQWSKMINEAPDGMSKTPAAALLRSARPREIEADTLTISFKYPIYKTNLEKLDNLKTAEKIISSFMGRPCKVRCVYEHENNPLVKAALKMGAQVIEAEEK
jgi:hypothetical protein